MILKFALKYFILNRRRTVRGAHIVAIGLIVIASTNLLINGLSKELSNLTQLLGYESNGITIEPIKGELFDEVTLNEIKIYLDKTPSINTYLIEYLTIGNISAQQMSNVALPFHIINITQLLPLGDPDTVFVTSEIQISLKLVIGNYYSIRFNSVNISRPLSKVLNIKTESVDSGLYIDYKLLGFDDTISNRVNIQLTEGINPYDIIDELNQIDNINVKITRAESKFLESSAKQITTTLLVLQTAISILVFLSIWNIMNVVVLESKYDIRILRSLGYNKFQITLLFIIIGFLIGLLGGLLTILISYILVAMILSSIAFVFDLPYINANFDTSEIIGLLINSILISTLSSIYPSYKGVPYK